MNTPAKPSKSRGLEQPKTLEEIVLDLLNTQLEGQETIKYLATEALTEIQALIEREVIGPDIDKIYEVEGSSVAKYYVNKRLATQRQNLSKLIRGEE